MVVGSVAGFQRGGLGAMGLRWSGMVLRIVVGTLLPFSPLSGLRMIECLFAPTLIHTYQEYFWCA